MKDIEIDEQKHEKSSPRAKREQGSVKYSMSLLSCGNLSGVHLNEFDETPIKLRKNPEYKAIWFVVFPDDYIKIVWDLLILW